MTSSSARELAAELHAATKGRRSRDMVEYQVADLEAIASELERLADLEAAARRTHANLIGMYGDCPFCEYHEGIGMELCELGEISDGA